MNKQDLINTANKIKNINKTLWRYTLPLLVATLTLVFTPICVIHYCDAGSIEMETAIGLFLVVFAYLYIFYGKMPKKRWKYILCVITWLIVVLLITTMYLDWIHGQNSPWPSTMRLEKQSRNTQ